MNERLRKLNPDSAADMDAFNERYSAVCEQLGLPRDYDPAVITFQQAASVLGITEMSVRRMAYDRARNILELGGSPYKTRGVTLDSVVEYLMMRPWRRATDK